MKTLDALESTFVVRWDYPDHTPDLVLAVKRLPGRRYDKTLRHWTVPSSSVAEVATFCKEWRIRVTPEALELGKAARSLLNTSGAIQLDEAFEVAGIHPNPCSVPYCGGQLRPFQKVGVKYAMTVKRTFIADDVGLGKTVEALTVLHAASAYPAVVVTTASGKNDWKREIKHWTPQHTIEIVNGKDPVGTTADIVVINWQILEKHVEGLLKRGLQAVVFDESQLGKSAKAKRTKAAEALSKDVEYRLNLSATPSMNRPIELLSQLQLIGQLEQFGGFWGYAKRYCAAHKVTFGRKSFWDFSGSSHLPELNGKLRASCFIRRAKRDVLTELPPVQHAPVDLDLTNIEEYRRAEADVIEYLSDIDIDKATSAELAEAITQIGVLRRLSARGKMAGAAEWIETFLESGEKLIVFAWHQEIVEELGRLFNCPAITGDTPKKKFDEVVDRFQTDPSLQLIVINVQVGGVQKTLTAASNVAFMEYGWNWSTHEQAIGRVYGRLNDIHGANAWWLRALGSIDEDMLTMIEAKRVVTETINDGESAASREDSGIKDLIQRLVVKVRGKEVAV